MIYVFLAKGFEEIEALATVDILRRAELEVVTVGIGDDVIAGSHGMVVLADTTDFDLPLDPGTLDMIVLPGGLPGTLNLEGSKNVQTAVDFCLENNKYVAAICAAPSILGHRGLLDGKTVTAHHGFREEVGGGNYTGAPVEVDGNIITARGAGVTVQFALKLVELLKGKPAADKIKMAMGCDF